MVRVVVAKNKEKTGRGRFDVRASWGAAVLRPYMIVVIVMIVPGARCRLAVAAGGKM